MEPHGASSALASEGRDFDWLTRYPQLKPLHIPNVLPTGKVLGPWGWGLVEELEIDEHRTAAGKRLEVSHLPVQSQVDELVHECVLLSELRHPNIVQFLGVCSLRDSPFPVQMTEVLSLSLEEFFQNDSVKAQHIYPHAIKWYFLTDVAHGLLYLHSCSPPVVHRYLNPVTIMLSYNMVAKITSFRYARRMGQIRSQFELEVRVGWREMYVPPEGHFVPAEELFHQVVRGVRSGLYCDPKFDVFSYAAVALFVLTHVSS